MKSRISFFNATIFRKNITRFAPCWGLYTVIMALLLINIYDVAWFTANVAGSTQVMSVVNCIYALIVGSLLFSDLFTPRMCNALHAMPLRRETFFGTNLISGFAFQLIPTGLFSLVCLVIFLVSGLKNAWAIAPLWLLASSLQFLFFFSLVALSVMCVGSRLAMSVVYFLLNFASMILFSLVDSIFIPMYYGVRLNSDPFQLFSPVVRLCNGSFVDVERIYAPSTHYDRAPKVMGFQLSTGDTFLYTFIVAALGIAILLLALQLYRKRHLEAAGDFIALRILSPVFLVIYALVVGFFLHAMFGVEPYIFLFIGLTVGWFTGLMLLSKTPRVFSSKNIFRGAMFLLVSVVTILIAYSDPFGIEGWVPQASQVKSVTLADGYYDYHNVELTLDDPEDIQRILEIHQETLDNLEEDESIIGTVTRPATSDPADWDFHISLTFTYHLTGGRTAQRYYPIWVGGESGQYLRRAFSSPQAVFGKELTPEEFAEENPRLIVHDSFEGTPVYLYDAKKVQGLYEAMLLDCAEGNLCQVHSLHPNNEVLFWLDNNDPNTPELHITSAATHTLDYLRSLGVDVDHLQEELGLIDP